MYICIYVCVYVQYVYMYSKCLGMCVCMYVCIDNYFIDDAGKKMRDSVIADGYSIFNWKEIIPPNTAPEDMPKDINDAVKSGLLKRLKNIRLSSHLVVALMSSS